MDFNCKLVSLKQLDHLCMSCNMPQIASYWYSPLHEQLSFRRANKRISTLIAVCVGVFRRVVLKIYYYSFLTFLPTMMPFSKKENPTFRHKSPIHDKDEDLDESKLSKRNMWYLQSECMSVTLVRDLIEKI